MFGSSMGILFEVVGGSGSEMSAAFQLNGHSKENSS